MDVSENRGTPKSSNLVGFSIINHPFWGTLIFGNTQVVFPYVSIWLGRFGVPPQATDSLSTTTNNVEALEVKYPKQWLEGADVDVGKTGNALRQNDKGKNRKVGEGEVIHQFGVCPRRNTQNTLEETVVI